MTLNSPVSTMAACGALIYNPLGLLNGTLPAGISAYLRVHYFLTFIRRVGMQPFVLYCLFLGVMLLYPFR